MPDLQSVARIEQVGCRLLVRVVHPYGDSCLKIPVKRGRFYRRSDEWFCWKRCLRHRRKLSALAARIEPNHELKVVAEGALALTFLQQMNELLPVTSALGSVKEWRAFTLMHQKPQYDLDYQSKTRKKITATG